MKKFVTALVVASGLALSHLPAMASDGEYYCPPGAKFCPAPPGNGIASAPVGTGQNQAPFGQVVPPRPYGQDQYAPAPGPRVASREPRRNYFESQLNEGETLIMVSPGGGPVDGLTPGAIYMGPPADYDMGPMATNYMRQTPPPEEMVKYYPLDVYTPGQQQPPSSMPGRGPAVVSSQVEQKYYPLDVYTPGQQQPYQTAPAPYGGAGQLYASAPAPASAGFMPPSPAYMPPPPGHQRQVVLTPPAEPVPVMAAPSMVPTRMPPASHQARQQPPYHEAFQEPARRPVNAVISGRNDGEYASRQANSSQVRPNRKVRKAEVISEIANETAQNNRPAATPQKLEKTEKKVPWWKGGFLKKKKSD